MRIRLPLTLAIIDGFRVCVGPVSYVVPLDMVIECLDLGPFLESEENHLLNLRGEVLPFLRLRDVFRMGGEAAARERVVVVQYGETRAGLVVDKLMGEFQTVIKPLGDLFKQVRGVGGSTILGSGEVALILDVPALIQLASFQGHKTPVLSSTAL
jgi:two-component system chemotaxis sensor kinase CheA